MKMRAKLYTILVLLCLALPACCETIGSVKKLLDGPSVMVTGIVTSVNPGECYIESADRASGIWVEGYTTDLSLGDEVTAAGTLSTIDGERVITSSILTPTGEQKLVSALGMPLNRVGGSKFGYQDCVSDYTLVKNGQTSQLQWVTPKGLNNTGLLVTTWGKVTTTNYSYANDLHWFHIDDGSGITSDFQEKGVIVYSDAPVEHGQFVSVTGVSSVETALDDPAHLIRVLRPRSSADVQVQKESVPEYPFSDEFSGTGIDPHWGKVGKLWVGSASVSEITTVGTTSVESGALKMEIITPVQPTGFYSTQLVQGIDGDWDMEVKLRIVPTLGQMVYQSIGIALKDTPSMATPMIASNTNPDGSIVNWLAAITPQTSQSPDQITGRMRYIVVDKQVGYPATELDTFARQAWFKVGKRGQTVYGSASTDGVHYSQERSTTCYNRCYVAICGYSYSSYTYSPGPFTGYCDYIRSTRVSE